MSYFWVEVIKQENGKNKIRGLHDSTSKSKPSPSWGGNAVLPLSELSYKVLSACRGDIKLLLDTVKYLDEWLEGEKS